MFYEYDKPLVLLGQSSSQEQAELLRLAQTLHEPGNPFFASPMPKPPRILIPQSFSFHANKNATTTTTTTTNNKNGVVVQIVPDDQLIHNLLMMTTTMRNNNNNNDTTNHQNPPIYAWPDIIVIDTAAAALDEKDDDSNSSSNSDSNPALVMLARRLYHDASLLMIHVNVEPTGAWTRSNDEQARKQALEETVFVPFSDYELCLRNEGILVGNHDDHQSDDNHMDNGNDHGGDDSSSLDDWEHVEWELTRLLARARLIPALPGDRTRSTNTAHLTMGPHTFFLSLSFPDIDQVQPYAAAMCTDVDAMEYRTDLLSCRHSRFELLYGMQQLRRYCRPHAIRVPALPLAASVLEDVMPIVYTVRTQNQAGTFPVTNDDEQDLMFQMLQWGLRGGVEVLDVESAWDETRTKHLLDLAQARYASQILGSHHVVGDEPVTLEEAVRLFEQCALQGRAHGAKVVLSIDSEEKDRLAYEAGLIATELARQEQRPVIPHIALVLGTVGQFSRIINLPFTPVTHERLPTKAAPGQLTAMEIMTTRLLTKIFESKKYAILGHNIAYSVSPQMHGAAFRATKLPHDYVRADVATVQEFVQSDFFNSGDFGGTSVTIPHKQAIIPYMDVLSDEARRIGSVNTVIAKEEYNTNDEEFQRVLYGDNTDWKGIYNPLHRLLGGGGAGSAVDPQRDYALLLGAGGTARAAAFVVAEKLGLQLLYYNRTPSKAAELAESFGGTVVESLEQHDVVEDNSSPVTTSIGRVLDATPGSRVRVVISTLPASANFPLPSWILEQQPVRPIIFDVNYKPYQTSLLEQAIQAGCQVVRGSEMLWEQGIGQFELWTGRTAPYAVMKQVVLENCQVSVLE
ncbi:hypothetical protein ACA910_015837 [Epithemia clementina (nom. ined.)]